MIEVIQIYENEELVLDDISLQIASNMKKNNPNLQFHVEENRLIFDAYTVGTIQIFDKVINILPRNSVFSLSTIFEMILFNNNIISDNNSAGYDYICQNGILFLPSYFYSACKKLIDFGLTGGYTKKLENSPLLKGELILEKFNQNIIKSEGLFYYTQNYTLDIIENQIIKAALKKIIMSKQNTSDSNQFYSLLREMESIGDFYGNVNDFEKKKTVFFSSNPYYPEVLNIALTILKELKLSFSNGSIQWYSFLQNSNNLFETYIRKLILNNIKLPVEKWSKPKNYASIIFNNLIGYKSYSPDILIGYNENTSSAKVVIDVKNKKFNPNNKSISELIEPSDVYQILFYCRKLKTKLGGLVYPCDENYEPIRMNIDDDDDIKIVLISVNMKLNYRGRTLKLKNDLLESLLKYI